jgi:hypothetical protein
MNFPTMDLPSIFESSTTFSLHERINSLTPQTVPIWGKMNVGQMLSHCQVIYQQILGENKQKPAPFTAWMLRTFFKKSMVNDVPYKPNLPTAPAFVRLGQEFDFVAERQKLKNYITQIQELGPEKMASIPSLTLKKLSAREWNNLIYKHIDHHLKQFGV